MASIEVLGKSIVIELETGAGVVVSNLDQAALLAGARSMADLINAKEWPPHYRDAFRQIHKIVFFEGQVLVNGYLMDRPCCDEDDAIFYWEAAEFMRNTDADVRANTFFHDCWHVVQYKHAGNKFASGLAEQLVREVDAITHQIGVAHMLGCDQREIAHLENFRGDQRRIAERLDEGVDRLMPHRTGDMIRHA